MNIFTNLGPFQQLVLAAIIIFIIRDFLSCKNNKYIIIETAEYYLNNNGCTYCSVKITNTHTHKNLQKIKVKAFFYDDVNKYIRTNYYNFHYSLSNGETEEIQIEFYDLYYKIMNKTCNVHLEVLKSWWY